MKRKNIFRTMLSLLMTVVVVFSTFGANIALAATVVGETKTTEYTLSDWGYDFQGSGLPNAYDPLSGKSDNNQFRYQWANDFYYWKDSSGRISYCVQLGAKHVDSVTMSQIKLNGKSDKYYPNETQRQNLNYATIYAYKGTTKYGYTWKEELVASQCLIWAISGKYFDSSTTSLGSNETKLLNCIKAPSTSAKNNMIACYKKMKADVLSHRTIAKGMGTSDDIKTAVGLAKVTYTLKYNSSTNKWECTVPSNRYLSHFKTPSVSGVTFTRSGNNLKVSASTYQALLRLEKAGAVKFTKTRNINSKTIEACTPVFLAAKTSTGSSQAKVSYVQGSDPVKGYMAFEGDYGSVTITKTASDANGKTYTATSTANKALNSAVRFKLKASNGNWVNATHDASGKYTYTRHDSAATGAVFALDANGKFTVAGLPIS